MDEFDPRAAFESITVTTTASVRSQDTYALLENPRPSSSSSVLLHKHKERIQVREEVEAIRAATYSEAFNLHPRFDDDGELGVKEKSFTISGVEELQDLLKNEENKDSENILTDDSDTILGEDSQNILGVNCKVENGAPNMHLPQHEALYPGFELLEWKRQNARSLKEKEERDKEKISQVIATAEERKRDFFNKRHKHLQTVKKTNREQEKSMLKSREEFHEKAHLNYWKAVSELTLLSPQGNKKPAVAVNAGPKPGKPTDLSRMRQIILKLKQKALNTSEPGATVAATA